MDKNERLPFFDVIILGAGWTVMIECKYCLGEGLKTLVLERRDSIGGVWSFTQDGRYGGVMTTTETTSSRCITEMSDFPMPETYPEFPSHVHILAYLKAYCDRFDLERHIRLDHRVDSAQGRRRLACHVRQRFEVPRQEPDRVVRRAPASQRRVGRRALQPLRGADPA